MSAAAPAPGEIPISAVVCTFNRADYLRKALRALQGQTLPPERFEILVVDNASTDHTAALVREEFGDVPNLRYLLEPEPGLSHARNRGYREARGRYVAYLDDDAIPTPHWLERIVEAFETVRPRPGAVGGRIDPLWEVEQPAWLHDEIVPLLTTLDLSEVPILLGEHQYLLGANLALPRAVLEEIGGFQVRLGRRGDKLLGNEETLLRQQLNARGYACYYDPEIRVAHHIPGSRLSQRWFMRRLYWQGISNALEQIHRESLGWSGRLRFALPEIGRLATSPRFLANAALPTEHPGRFMTKCWTLSRLGYVLGLIGLKR